MVKRKTAYKIEIAEIIKGNYTEDGLILLNGQKIIRARILGTIVAKFFSDERTYGFVVLDDGTETIRIKAYKEQVELFENFKIGDIIEVFGRIKEWEDEIYVLPDYAVLIDDPNWEVLRKFELAQDKRKHPDIINSKTEIAKDTNESLEVIEDVIQSPRQKIRELIEKMDGGEGALVSELKKQHGDETAVEKILTELMNEGEIFEPRPGKVKLMT